MQVEDLYLGAPAKNKVVAQQLLFFYRRDAHGSEGMYEVNPPTLQVEDLDHEFDE